MGTIGGNIVNASPAADSLAPFLIHDAVAVLESQDGARRMKIEDFILAPYRTAINARELLTVIEINGLTGYREGYKRVTKRSAWAISRLSIAWAIQESDGLYKDVKLAIGSCTPMPFRPRAIEETLRGKAKSDDTIRTAIEGILEDIKRISGVRPSFAYKMPVVKDLLSEIFRGEKE
jgi:CO/xanthine dehydrogenase FAD-binding subunit